MNILIVFGSQFGITEQIARHMGDGLAVEHQVVVLDVDDAHDMTGERVNLLIVGAPSQLGGTRILVQPFLAHLADKGFAGVPAAAFDTRHTKAGARFRVVAAEIAKRLSAAGCRIVMPPEGFLVDEHERTALPGEEARAAVWALSVARTVVADDGSTPAPA